MKHDVACAASRTRLRGRPFRPKTDLKLSRSLPADISSRADFLASFPVIAAEIEGAPRATDKN